MFIFSVFILSFNNLKLLWIYLSLMYDLFIITSTSSYYVYILFQLKFNELKILVNNNTTHTYYTQ